MRQDEESQRFASGQTTVKITPIKARRVLNARKGLNIHFDKGKTKRMPVNPGILSKFFKEVFRASGKMQPKNKLLTR